MKNEIKDLNVCEIGTLYLLKINAKKGLIETTSRALPDFLGVDRKTGLKLINGLEEAGFLHTERTYGAAGKLKIFIGNGVKFPPLTKNNGVKFPPLEKAETKGERIEEIWRNSYENLDLKNDVKAKNPPSFPLNKPLINPINYNLTNNNKTTNNITPAHTHSANDNNNLFKLEKPSFPNFTKAGKFADIVIDFFNYRKKDLKKPIKTQRGLDRLISRLKAFSNENIDIAKAICEQSKDHEWQDIFELKNKPAILPQAKENLKAQEQKRRAFLDSLIGDK